MIQHHLHHLSIFKQPHIWTKPPLGDHLDIKSPSKMTLPDSWTRRRSPRSSGPRCSLGSSFQEPLIISFSHCCWQFSTSVLWEPPLTAIVFFLSDILFSLVRGHFTLHSEVSQAFADFFKSQQEKERESERERAFKIVPRTLSLRRKSASKLNHLTVKRKLANWLPQYPLNSATDSQGVWGGWKGWAMPKQLKSTQAKAEDR